jgi:hypothetical protein
MSDSRDDVAIRPALRSARARTYLDEHGQRWLVTEQPFSQYDRRSGYSLIFASDLAVRRVREYPNDWDSLSVEALMELSWNV